MCISSIDVDELKCDDVEGKISLWEPLIKLSNASRNERSFFFLVGIPDRYIVVDSRSVDDMSYALFLRRPIDVVILHEMSSQADVLRKAPLAQIASELSLATALVL